MSPTAAELPARRPKGPSFVDSFWSSDYAGGLGVLFTKLQQGVVENQQVLTIATMRAEAEEIYAERLGDIAPTIDRINGGFGRDDGASVRKVDLTLSPLADAADTLLGIRRGARRNGGSDQEPPEDREQHPRACGQSVQ